jgi:hypothetical protein
VWFLAPPSAFAGGPVQWQRIVVDIQLIVDRKLLGTYLHLVFAELTCTSVASDVRLDDFLSREQEEYKGTLAAEAGRRLAARLARQRQVGDLLKRRPLSYTTACVATSAVFPLGVSSSPPASNLAPRRILTRRTPR